MGNRLFLYTQTAWRPSFGDFFAEWKLGAGYMFAFRPVVSYRFENGAWKSGGKRGKTLLSFPLGVSLGYNHRMDHRLLAHFASYQFLLVTDYNQDIPLVPETLIQLGSRLYLK